MKLRHQMRNPFVTHARIMALSKTKTIPDDMLGLTFTLTHYVIRVEDKIVELKYSPYFISDIELIFQLMAYGMNLDNIINAKYDLKLLNVDAESFIHPDCVTHFLSNHIDDIRTYNLMHWGLTPVNETRLVDISKKLKSVIDIDKHKMIDSIEVANIGIFTHASIYEKLENKYILPGFLILACYLRGNDRNYFISDLHGFDVNKLNYYTRLMHGVVFYDMSPMMFSMLFLKNSYESINHTLKTYMTIHKNIIDSIPNTIDKFPFNVLSFYIPSMSTYPTTKFQWLITNLLASYSASEYSLEIGNMPNSNSPQSIKESTTEYLNYVNCDEKAFELYCEYMRIDADTYLDFIDSVSGKDKKGFLQSAIQYGYTGELQGFENGDKEYKVDTIYEPIKNMLRFICDGEDICKTYPNPIELEGGYIVKMSPVEGTILKQVRNSIFNHREEQKLSIEHKLKLLEEGEPMYIDVKLPAILEQLRIKSKRYMIFSGKELKHCLGGKTESKNLFFRRDTVCAEVTHTNGSYSVVMCLDTQNSTTNLSKDFKKFLIDEFEKIMNPVENVELTLEDILA